MDSNYDNQLVNLNIEVGFFFYNDFKKLGLNYLISGSYLPYRSLCETSFNNFLHFCIFL